MTATAPPAARTRSEFVHERLLRCPHCTAHFEPSMLAQPKRPGEARGVISCEQCHRDFHIQIDTVTKYTSPPLTDRVPSAGMVSEETSERGIPPVHPTETNGRRH